MRVREQLVHFGVMGRNRIIDHRGTQIRHAQASDHLPRRVRFVVHPENTLAAFKASMAAGHDIELDVNANGEMIHPDNEGKTGRIPYLPVFHDDAIGNPFQLASGEKPFLRDMPTDAIANAKFNRKKLIHRVISSRLGLWPWLHPDMPGSRVHLDNSPDATRIPRLDEVFSLLKKHPGTHAYVELKTLTQGNQENTKGLELSVVSMIQNYQLQDQVTVIGFNPFGLAKVKAIAQGMGLSRLTTAWDLEPGLFWKTKAGKAGLEQLLGWAKQIGVSALLPAYAETDADLVQAAHANGLKVMPWVWPETRAQELRRIPQLFRMGADAVITNVPSDAQALLDSGKASV